MNLFAGRKIDGQVPGERLVEFECRTKCFRDDIPEYDGIQVQAYSQVFDLREGQKLDEWQARALGIAAGDENVIILTLAGWAQLSAAVLAYHVA